MPAPANDDIANAYALDPSGETVAGTTVDATLEASEDPIACGINDNTSTVWYSLTAPSGPASAYRYSLVVDPSTSAGCFSATQYVFTNQVSPAFPELDFGPSSSVPLGDGGSAGQLLSLAPSETAWIQVASTPATEQAFTLTLTLVAAGALANDTLASALTVASETIAGTTTGSGGYGAYPFDSPQNTQGYPTAWFTFVPPTTGSATITIESTTIGWNPYAEIYNQDVSVGTPAALPWGSYADAASMTQTTVGDGTETPPSVDFDVFQGQRVYIQVTIWDTTLASGDFTLSLFFPSAPQNRALRRHWRYLLADLDGTPISFWDTQARNRQIEFTLNGATAISGAIDSGNPQANLTHTDGFPYLSEGDRLLYAFRRDYDGGGSTYAWTCRAAGIILEVNDTGGVDSAETTFVAYDPWQYLMSLPVVGVPTSASEEGTVDVTFTLPLDEIVVTLLQDAHDTYSFANPAKTGIDLAGGTIESLPEVTMTFQRETSIGQCLQQCAAQGCDIVLTPVYDPLRPGVLCDLNVYAWAGDLRPDATFAWDKGRRSVVDDNREIDGTQRQNNIRYHLRAEADSSEGTTTVTEPASVTRFGDYWGTRYWPAAEHLDVIQELAEQELSEFSENKRTVSLGPVPERSPDPFTEWYLGDFVRVYASRKLRASQSGYQRVTGFTVDISDDALETVRDLRVYIPLEPAS